MREPRAGRSRRASDRRQSMASSCSEARAALVECLADSPLFLEGKAVKECVLLSKDHGGCKELNTALFNCRRGQVCTLIPFFIHLSLRLFFAFLLRAQLDMRKRIKGNLYFQGEGDKTESDASSEKAKS